MLPKLYGRLRVVDHMSAHFHVEAKGNLTTRSAIEGMKVVYYTCVFLPKFCAQKYINYRTATYVSL